MISTLSFKEEITWITTIFRFDLLHNLSIVSKGGCLSPTTFNLFFVFSMNNLLLVILNHLSLIFFEQFHLLVPLDIFFNWFICIFNSIFMIPLEKMHFVFSRSILLGLPVIIKTSQITFFIVKN